MRMVVGSDPITKVEKVKAEGAPEEPEPTSFVVKNTFITVLESHEEEWLPEEERLPEEGRLPEEERSAGHGHTREDMLPVRHVLGQPVAPGPGDLKAQWVEDKNKQSAVNKKGADDCKIAGSLPGLTADAGTIAGSSPGWQADEASQPPTLDGSPDGENAGGASSLSPTAGSPNVGDPAYVNACAGHSWHPNTCFEPWYHTAAGPYPNQASFGDSFSSLPQGSYGESPHGLDFPQGAYANSVYDLGQAPAFWLPKADDIEAWASLNGPDREALAARFEKLAVRVRNTKAGQVASEGAAQHLQLLDAGAGVQGPAEVLLQSQQQIPVNEIDVPPPVVGFDGMAGAGTAGVLWPLGPLPPAAAGPPAEERLPPAVPSEVSEGPKTQAFNKLFQVSSKQFASDKKWGPKDIKFDWNDTQVEAKVSLKPPKLAGRGAGGGKKPEFGKLEFRIREPPDGLPYMNVILKMGDREIWSQWHLFRDGYQGIVADKEVNLKAKDGEHNSDKVEIVVQGFLSDASGGEESDGALNKPQQDLY